MTNNKELIEKPCGDVEYGNCEICHTQTYLQRTYFHYDIKCECHSPDHFDMVRHCKNCTPTKPEVTTIKIKTSELASLKQAEPAEVKDESLSIEEIKKDALKYLNDKYPDIPVDTLEGASIFMDFSFGLQVGYDLARIQIPKAPDSKQKDKQL
jgi:hypothetical protein